MVAIFSLFNYAVDSKLFTQTSAWWVWALICGGWCHAHAGFVVLVASIIRDSGVAAVACVREDGWTCRRDTFRGVPTRHLDEKVGRDAPHRTRTMQMAPNDRMNR